MYGSDLSQNRSPKLGYSTDFCREVASVAKVDGCDSCSPGRHYIFHPTVTNKQRF